MSEELSTTLAEQQILGFIHASHGYTFRMLIISMGLTKDEWEAIKKRDMIISEFLITDIDNYFDGKIK